MCVCDCTYMDIQVYIGVVCVTAGTGDIELYIGVVCMTVGTGDDHVYIGVVCVTQVQEDDQVFICVVCLCDCRYRGTTRCDRTYWCYWYERSRRKTWPRW